jgi:hypothetical protein
MSSALTDLLIEVSDPVNLRLFEQDPELFMSSRRLTEADKDALRSRRRELLRFNARSIDEDDRRNEYRQFSQPGYPAAFLIDELHVEMLSLNNQDMTYIRGIGPLFIDKDGCMYRGTPITQQS